LSGGGDGLGITEAPNISDHRPTDPAADPDQTDDKYKNYNLAVEVLKQAVCKKKDYREKESAECAAKGIKKG